MTDIDLKGLDVEQLSGLVGKIQTEMATREKRKRQALRSELERRVTDEGYKMGDIFPELGNSTPAKGRRRKLPAKYRNPQNPDETWTGIGRSPKWVQSILNERGIDMASFKSIPMYQIHTVG